MTTPESRKGPAGIVVGSLVAITFGTVFVLFNSSALPAPWPVMARAAGLLIAALLLAGLGLVVRQAPPVTAVPVSGFIDRRFWIILALEGLAIFGGLWVVNGLLEPPRGVRRLHGLEDEVSWHVRRSTRRSCGSALSGS